MQLEASMMSVLQETQWLKGQERPWGGGLVELEALAGVFL